VQARVTYVLVTALCIDPKSTVFAKRKKIVTLDTILNGVRLTSTASSRISCSGSDISNKCVFNCD